MISMQLEWFGKSMSKKRESVAAYLKIWCGVILLDNAHSGTWLSEMFYLLNFLSSVISTAWRKGKLKPFLCVCVCVWNLHTLKGPERFEIEDCTSHREEETASSLLSVWRFVPQFYLNFDLYTCMCMLIIICIAMLAPYILADYLSLIQYLFIRILEINFIACFR